MLKEHQEINLISYKNTPTINYETKSIMQIDKDIFKDIDTGIPNFIENDYPLDWSMTRNESYCLVKLLEKIKPKIAIEIGVYNGGSLQVLSLNSKKVYAIDIDPSVKERLKNNFNNVEFLIGDSKIIVPKLIKELQKNNESLEFALIDGDHSELGVKSDLENILNYTPLKSLNIILHDSFNPTCRKGMKSINYNNNEHIHYVELDYISGVYEPDGLKKEMWGGFAHIVLLKDIRKGKLLVHQSQEKIFNIAYLHSKHFLQNKLRFLKPIIKLIRK